MVVRAADGASGRYLAVRNRVAAGSCRSVIFLRKRRDELQIDSRKRRKKLKKSSFADFVLFRGDVGVFNPVGFSDWAFRRQHLQLEGRAQRSEFRILVNLEQKYRGGSFQAQERSFNRVSSWTRSRARSRARSRKSAADRPRPLKQP